MRMSLAMLVAAWATVFCLDAGAACPVGKKEGDTWCEKAMEWKCEKCGSEYCPIITGNRCVKDDEPERDKLPAFGRFLSTEPYRNEVMAPARATSNRQGPANDAS